ncbi:hypothetical protein MASR1M90_21830 [Desulfovibrionales bacterium]
MLNGLHKKLERFLYGKGFHVPEVRSLAGNQIIIFCASAPLAFYYTYGLDFFSGVALGTLNFLALALVIQEIVFLRQGAVLIQMLSFYGRLIVSAVILYALIVYKQSSVAAILAGFSTVLVNISLWGLVQFWGKKSKEA